MSTHRLAPALVAVAALLPASTALAETPSFDACDEAYGMTCPELFAELIKYEGAEVPKVVAEFEVEPVPGTPPTCLTCPPDDFFAEIKDARIIELEDLSLLVIDLADATKTEQLAVHDVKDSYAEAGAADILGDVEIVMGLGSSSRELYLVADKLVDNGIHVEAVAAKEWITAQ